MLDTCREVYNSCLHWRKHDYELLGTSLTNQDQQNALPIWKQSHPELCCVHSLVLQNVCRRVDLAYQAYFERLHDYKLCKEQGRLKVVNSVVEKCPGPPRSKGRGCYDSLTYTQSTTFRVGEKSIRFSKIGDIKAVIHRPIPGVMKTATIRARIRNRRHNFHHQEARMIVDRYGVITVEKLNVSNLSKAPAPKQDQETGNYLPNGHAAKAGLNKSILDAGWSSFRMLLKSKAESAGREFYEVDPAYTSQDCARCDYRPPPEERKTLSDRWHACPKCGYSVHRDKNSAVLIDKIGVGLHTVRQRPIEAPPFTAGE